MWIKAEMVYGKRGDNDTRPVHQLINMNNVCSISTGSYKPEEAGSEWAECTIFDFVDGSTSRTKMTWEELELRMASGSGFPDSLPRRFPLDVKRKPLPGERGYIGLDPTE